MRRGVVLVIVVTVMVVGCRRKAPTSAADSDDPGSPVAIKFREERKGDRYRVVSSESGTTTVTGDGPKGKLDYRTEQRERYAYTETLEQWRDDSDRPTRVTRAYTVAERSDGGPTKQFSYAGQTVLIQRIAGRYVYTVNGKPLPNEEAVPFRDSFENPTWAKPELFQPKQPVRVNETWELDPAVLTGFAHGNKLPLVASKSRATGKLLKTYQKGEQQWGTIEFRMLLVLEETDGGVVTTGTGEVTATMESAIDASTLESSMKMQTTMKVTHKNTAKGYQAVTEVEVTREETRSAAE